MLLLKYYTAQKQKLLGFLFCFVGTFGATQRLFLGLPSEITRVGLGGTI